MHITLLLDYSYNRVIGGPQGVAYDTVMGLKKSHARLEKDDVHVHIMSTTGATLHSVFERDDTCPNISYEFFRSLVPTAVSADINYLLRIRNKRENIDILHSHVLPGAFIGTLLKIPTILTLHGMIWREKDYYKGMYLRCAAEVNERRFTYTSRRLKKLIAISPYVKKEVDHILKTMIPDTEVVENPISDIFFEQEKREKEGLILYPAYFSSLKNQYNLIEALFRLKKDNIRFHCILPGLIMDYGYYAKIQKLIDKYDLRGSVTLPGPVPLEQMLMLYSETSIMVMTSFQETAPLVISEAMATGTPVIASRVSGIPYMVSEGTSGFLINPRDPKEIADKIGILLDDRSLREKFRKESQEIARSRWKSTIIINKLLDIYEQP